MAYKISGVGHVALRVTSLERARQFYIETLGFRQVREADGMFLMDVAGTTFGVIGDAKKTRKNDKFNPFRVGLDHIALEVETDALDSLKQGLDTVGVPNNGIEADELTGASYISFYDPDGIAWELYALPSS